jgi:electron transfer flavoprotein alpha/beta subunit
MEEKTLYTVEDAQAAIKADEQARIARTAQRIRAILDEERTDLIAVPQFTADGRTVAVPQIVTR